MMDERIIGMNGVYTNLTSPRALPSMIVRGIGQSIKKGAEAPWLSCDCVADPSVGEVGWPLRLGAQVVGVGVLDPSVGLGHKLLSFREAVVLDLAVADDLKCVHRSGPRLPLPPLRGWDRIATVTVATVQRYFIIPAIGRHACQL